MEQIKTKLGTTIPETTRGIVYLCEFKNMTLIVTNEILCDNAGVALNLYAEIPNPESQLVMGKTYEELISNLELLHKNMINEYWLLTLSEEL